MKRFFRALLMLCLSSTMGIALPSNEKSATSTTLKIDEKNTFNLEKIKDLTSITKIEVSYCQISDKNFETLLTKLKATQSIDLEIAGIKITQNMWETICHNAQKINRLNLVYLEESNIQKNDWEKLFNQLGTTQIIDLELAGIKITQEMWNTICHNAQKINRLNLVYLEESNIQKNDWEKLFNHQPKNLRELSIHDYTNKDYSLKELFLTLSKYQTKETIKLRLCFVEEEDTCWQNCFESVKDHSIECINDIYISSAKISKKNVASLLKMFKPNKIEFFYLNQNNINPNETVENQDTLLSQFKDLQIFYNFCSTLEEFFNPAKWKSSIKDNTLAINPYNIQALNFDDIQDVASLEEISVKHCQITEQQLEKLLAKLQDKQTITLKLAGIKITPEIWGTICKNAHKINRLDLVYLKESNIEENKWKELFNSQAKDITMLSIQDKYETSQKYVLQTLFSILSDKAAKKQHLSLAFTDLLLLGKKKIVNTDYWKNVIDEIDDSKKSIYQLCISDDRFTQENAEALLKKIIPSDTPQREIPLKILSLYSKKIKLNEVNKNAEITKRLSNLKVLFINEETSAINYDEVCKALHLPPKPEYYPLTAEENEIYKTAAKLFLELKNLKTKLPKGKELPKIYFNHREGQPASYHPKVNTIYISPSKIHKHTDLAEMMILHEFGHATEQNKSASELSAEQFKKQAQKNEIKADKFSATYCSSKTILQAAAAYFRKYIPYDKYHTEDDIHPTAKSRTKLFEDAAKNKKNEEKGLTHCIEETKKEKQKTKKSWWSSLFS